MKEVVLSIILGNFGSVGDKMKVCGGLPSIHPVHG
jgi:hypothetical protein